MNKIEIETEEAKEVFELLEELNDLFHQPISYENHEAVKTFAEKHYAKIHKLYYDTVWSWLPADIQNKYTSR